MSRTRSYRVHPQDLAVYPGLVIAVFVEAGFMDGWPLGWTSRGRAAVREETKPDRHYDGLAVFERACRRVRGDWRFLADRDGNETARARHAMRSMKRDPDREEADGTDEA